MSPLIRRILSDEPECSAGKISHAHEFYVPTAELQHGDVVLDPHETSPDSPTYIRPQVLAGLAVQFPREFAAAARARGLDAAPGSADADDADDEAGAGDDDLGPKAAEAERIVALKVGDAVAAIAACEDADVLAAVHELEEERARPRQAVLDALAAKGT